MSKIRDYQKKLNTPTRVILSVLGLSALSGLSQGTYPAVTKSVSMLIIIAVLLWVWGVPFSRGSKPKN